MLLGPIFVSSEKKMGEGEKGRRKERGGRGRESKKGEEIMRYFRVKMAKKFIIAL